MTAHKYILEPYNGLKSRYTCPQCSKGRIFTRYIDNETGQHLAPNVGKCNREIKCGCHYTPKQYFQDNNIPNGSIYKAQQKEIVTSPIPEKKISFISDDVFQKSLKIGNSTLQLAEANNFIMYLVKLFGIEITSQLVDKYYIGTSKHWNKATVFWQIDISGKIRTGKIMLYSPSTGKRIKEPFSYITWAHKAMKLADFSLQQCFYGEHLLGLTKNYNKPVAIVESEKTAIIASVYLPGLTWLAVGSLQNLTIEKCEVLKGRKVVLFPDLKAFDIWETKARGFKNITTFTISDLLERKATEAEKEQGFDLADYLIRFDYKEFLKTENY